VAAFKINRKLEMRLFSLIKIVSSNWDWRHVAKTIVISIMDVLRLLHSHNQTNDIKTSQKSC
jgi:hypothetical protein